MFVEYSLSAIRFPINRVPQRVGDKCITQQMAKNLKFPINRVPQRVGDIYSMVKKNDFRYLFPINRVPQRVGEYQYADYSSCYGQSFQSIASPSEQENKFLLKSLRPPQQFPINRVPQRVGDQSLVSFYADGKLCFQSIASPSEQESLCIQF